MDTYREGQLAEQGAQAREALRRGVEEALLALANGSLPHPEGTALRAALQGGSLTRDAYLQQLLRLVYRLILLLSLEERGLLHPEHAPEEVRRLYAEGSDVLTWLREHSGLSRLPWRDLAPEELGRVYESLLELVPRAARGGERFEFVSGAEARGHTRKLTGSYYTPDSLVQLLLDSALEPVVQGTLAAHPERPVEALLSLTIVDPACGSGHFLLAAARRLAGHVARLQANGTPSAEEYRRALRQVVERCLYGVDLNPMAVELCKVSLWTEVLEPGLPLTFLDSHILQGNALFGATPALVEQGIPEAAWEPIEGDDRKAASALKRRHREAAQGSPGADPRFAADAWCAAFVWPKVPGPLAEAAPTNELWQRSRAAQGQPPELTVKTVHELAARYHFFHWHLAFPQVFARGGFDVVLGNPPWERVKLQEQEFFASRSDRIARAPNAAARKKLISALPLTEPALWHEWCAASRAAEGLSHFARNSGRYPLCGKGDVNIYALFAELNRAVLRPGGRAGFIVPPGLATDDTTKEYFQELTATSSLASLYEFENEEFLFPAIDHRVRFLVLTIAGGAGAGLSADLSFGHRRVSSLADPERHFYLTPADFATLNPNTRTCPIFRLRRDAELNLALYRRAGILWREDDPDGNPWGIRFMRMLDMANDSRLFRTKAALEAAGWRREGNQYLLEKHRLLPLIEAKMVHHFDHRFGTYEGQTKAQANQGKLPELDDAAHTDAERLTLPRYWVNEAEVERRLEGRWERGWLLGWRDVCRSTDQRTLIASVIPRMAVNDKFLLMLPAVDPRLVACLYANLCSFVLDYCARQKVGGTSLKYFTMKQLPVLAPAAYAAPAPWAPKESVRDWLLPRVLGLTYTSWDLEPFARDCGYGGPPFLWDPERRFLLRAELDAAFSHLYGLSHGDTAYILDTFPVVRKSEEKRHGEYRTRRVILEIHDAMSEAARVGDLKGA